MVATAIDQTQRKCEHCGNPLIRKKKEGIEWWANRRFCSRSCHFQSLRPYEQSDRKCEHCGKIVARAGKYDKNWEKRRFCSQQCLGLSRMTIECKPCKRCGEMFRPDKGCRTFCSNSCYESWKCRNPWDIPKETSKMPDSTSMECETEQQSLNEDLIPLTAEESDLLREEESFITSGMKACRRAGKALETIRDQRLYRGTHRTWKEYLKERWQMCQPQAEGWIRMSRLHDYLDSTAPDIQEKPRTTATQVLRSLPPEYVTTAWMDALSESGGKTPTTALVRDVVNRYLGKSTGRRPDGQIVEDWKEGRFGDKAPEVHITLTTAEAVALGRLADTMGVRVHEAARRLVSKGLRFCEEFDAAA